MSHPYGNALTGELPKQPRIQRPESGIDIRVSDKNELLLLIWPEELPRDLNTEDIRLLQEHEDLFDALQHVVVSPEIAQECLREMSNGEKCGWVIPRDEDLCQS